MNNGPYLWLFALGYLLVIACYIPQWWRILRTGNVEGISPGLLGMLTTGLILIQVAAFSGLLGPHFAWANGAALANAAILDAAYIWAKRRAHA